MKRYAVIQNKCEMQMKLPAFNTNMHALTSKDEGYDNDPSVLVFTVLYIAICNGNI